MKSQIHFPLELVFSYPSTFKQTVLVIMADCVGFDFHLSRLVLLTRTNSGPAAVQVKCLLSFPTSLFSEANDLLQLVPLQPKTWWTLHFAMHF